MCVRKLACNNTRSTSTDLSPHSEDCSEEGSHSSTVAATDESSCTSAKAKQLHVTFSSSDSFQKPNARHVSFVLETENEIIPCPYEEIDMDELWYSAKELTAIRDSVIEVAAKCSTHPHALSWCRSLRDAYHELKSNSNGTPFWHALFSQSVPHHKGNVDAWYLGLEHWLLEKTMARELRRIRMFERISGWQKEKNISVSMKQQQIKCASERASLVPVKWAVYVAEQIAESVKSDQSLPQA